MKTVIITGGSRGIGAAAVRAFCARGDRVAFLYEKEDEKAQAVAAETGAQAVRCDVADEAAIRAAFSQLPGADVLINNAGIADYDLINVITPARWRRLFAVNVDGAQNYGIISGKRHVRRPFCDQASGRRVISA